MTKPSLVYRLTAIGFLIFMGFANAEEKVDSFSIHYSHAGLRAIEVKDGRLKYSWVTDRIGGSPLGVQTLDNYDQHQMHVWLTDKEKARFREWMVKNKVFDFKSEYPRRGRETYGSAFHSVLTVEQKDKKQGISWNGDTRTPESLDVAVSALIQLADEVRGHRYRKFNEERAPRKEEAPLDRGSREGSYTPLTEILSGKALNARIDTIRELQKHRGPGPNVPLDKDVLAKINVTRGDDGGSIGVLLKGSILEWPKALQGAAYEMERKKIGEWLRDAVKQAKKGEVAAKLTEELNQTIRNVQESLDEHSGDLPPDQFIESVRYLRSLKQAAKALRRKDIHDYFTAVRDLPAKCKNVADLITFLTERNLHIAPATPKDEAGYVALYHSLAFYAASIPANREKK